MATTLGRTGAVNLQPGDLLQAIHDFDARSPDELTLRKNDQVELVELDEGFGDGWFLGRHLGRGDTGLFPGVYTAVFTSSLTYGRDVRSTLPTHTSSQSQPQSVPVFMDGTSETNPYRSSPAELPSVSENDEKIDEAQTLERDASQTELNEMPAYYHQSTVNSPIAEQPENDVYQSYTPNSPPQRSVQAESLAQGVQPPALRPISQTLKDPHQGEDSPVMNETLTVIDEHITDLNTPRQSLVPSRVIPDDSGSDYSNSQMEQRSFIAGPETDDEDNATLSAEVVQTWDPRQTANHLRSIGMDPKHCDIFEEQEITGDVLLDMDQSFVYMKEYDFGVMGRRLKTWHKIRDFQNEVKGLSGGQNRKLANIPRTASGDSFTRQPVRPGASSTILPRIPSLMEKPGLNLRTAPLSNQNIVPSPLQTQYQPSSASYKRLSLGTDTPPSPWRTSNTPDSPNRLSSPATRETERSRRHSSIDFGHQILDFSAVSTASATPPHKKQSSLDQTWSMSNATPSSTQATTPSARHSIATKQEFGQRASDSPTVAGTILSDEDKGYFSGNEVENRKTRNTLRKRDSRASPSHSRQSSLLDDPRKSRAAVKHHSRLSSVDSIHLSQASSAAKAYHSSTYKGRFRSSSARSPTTPQVSGSMSPTVTNLEGRGGIPSPPYGSTKPSSGANTSDASQLSTKNVPSKALKVMGLRVISDNVTSERLATGSGSLLGESFKDSPVDSPTGSGTPSGTSRSFEVDNDASSKGTDSVGYGISTKISNPARPKTKQETSAYTRGLMQITPAEARKNCDYYGWMKKKSSGIMTTWKARFFILRGRRLSYYYSESDLSERGIIDISGHKVLAANSDSITTLHATITGAASTPVPSGSTPSLEASPQATRDVTSSTIAPFYFKLIPPKAGQSRTVQFTKPTVHYFQVESLVEGRKWMGEIMKATIEHNTSSLQTTNKQKTISLAKAKARQERPPALKDTGVTKEDKRGDTAQENGLNIKGLDFKASDVSLGISGEDFGGTKVQSVAEPTGKTV